MIRYGIHIIGRNNIVLRQRAIPWRRGSEYSVCAQVVRPTAAVVAMSAWHSWLDCYSVARLDIFHFAADFDDCAGALVAEDDWAVEDEVAYSSSLPVVNVRAANSGLVNVYSDVVLVAELRNWSVLEGYIFDGSEHEGWILRVVLEMRIRLLLE